MVVGKRRSKSGGRTLLSRGHLVVPVNVTDLPTCFVTKYPGTGDGRID